VSIFLGLTKSRVEHIECHLVALSRASNSDKSLVTVVLGFIDLDHAATEMSDLVDLGTTLANDGTDHVIRNEDLLGDRLTWHGARQLRMRLAVGCRLWYLTISLLRLWSTITWLAWTARGLCIGNLLRIRLVGLWCWLSILRVCTTTTSLLLRRLSAMSPVRVWVAVLTTGRLGYVWHNLHATRDNTSRTATSGSISRGCWAAEALGQLLNECYCDVVCCNVDGISDT